LKTQVFSDSGSVAKLSGQAADDMEALATGMRAERDSILFYQEMLTFVDSKDAKAAFDWILKEERKHLETLAARSQDCAGMTP
jgi:rubrerythrin